MFVVAASYRAYRLESYIEDLWEEVLRRDPSWLRRDALTLALLGTAVFAIVVLARLLLG